MRLVVGVWVVGVHVLDGVEDAFGVQGVVVLHDVVFDHHIKERPIHFIFRSYGFVSI